MHFCAVHVLLQQVVGVVLIRPPFRRQSASRRRSAAMASLRAASNSVSGRDRPALPARAASYSARSAAALSPLNRKSSIPSTAASSIALRVWADLLIERRIRGDAQQG